MAEYHYQKDKGKSKYRNVGSVRSSNAIPPTCNVYYFEMKVIDEGENGIIGIGLTSNGSKLNRMPGWNKNTIGYHGDNGKVYKGKRNGSKYGPSFGVGDVVGCGLDLKRNTVFFTKNGCSIGVAISNLPSNNSWYPTIGLHSRNEKIEVNFGQKDFAFDVSYYSGKSGVWTRKLVSDY